MVLTGLTKKRSENSKLYRLYRRAKRADYRKHLGGPLRTEWLALSRLLRKLSFDNPQEIVDYVAQAEWLHNADRDTKYMALSIIGHTISRLRVRNGYAPFDDSCYGEEPTAFEIIREQLR